MIVNKIPIPPKPPLCRIIREGRGVGICPVCGSTMIKTRLFFSKKECINPECVLSNKRGNKMEFTKKQEQVMVAAQTAYEAYCEYTGWKSLATGADLPKWENLPGNIKNAWFAAISSVIL